MQGVREDNKGLKSSKNHLKKTKWPVQEGLKSFKKSTKKITDIQREENKLTATWYTPVYWELIGKDMTVFKFLYMLNEYLVSLLGYLD